MKFRTMLLLLGSLFMFFSCANQNTKKTLPLDPANMDLSVKPGDDFFQFANGTWIKNHPIPDEYSRYGSFEILVEENYAQLKNLFANAEKNRKTTEDPTLEKIGTFYAVGMDEDKINQDGVAPLNAYFEKIKGIETKNELQKVVAEFHKTGIAPWFRIYAGQDDKNSEMVIPQLRQGGLGLPDRDYYTKTDNRSKEIREAYLQHLVKMFMLLGEDQEKAKSAAKTVMTIETRLAKASMTRLEQRDPHKTYNKMSVSKLSALSPEMGWNDYFKHIGLPDPHDVNINQPLFFQELSKTIKVVNLDNWKVYLTWNLINFAAPYLSNEFVDQDFEFFGKVLSGKQENQERWKRVQNATNRAMGEAVGQIYVKEYFPPEAKIRMLELVSNLKSALGERIKNLDWMGDATKKEALVKLKAMKTKIGYPDKWIDYSSLEVKEDSYLENVMRGRAFAFKRSIDKMNKPVDRDEWFMYPQTVNAYYNPGLNEIVFPAAILQFPFFNMEADDAVNYGAIGMVIGHEMTHGFDDMGRQYDVNGNLKDWWTKEDEVRFNKRTEVLVKQYDNFVCLDTLHVDGKLTLGENIADLGGLSITYDALQKALEGKSREKIDGFTPEQRLFLSLAQVWRQNIRDEELMRRLREDVHSPGKFRVNGPMMNMAVFYEAFDIKEGDALWIPLEQRAKIW